MIQNAAHLHLILNHFPAIAFPVATLILLFGLWRKSQDIIKTAFLVFILVGFVMIPLYLSGEGAEEVVERMPGIEHEDIEEHEDAAFFGLWSVEITAALSLLMFVFFFNHPVPKKFTITILLLALFTNTVIARVTHLGGAIHHPEIRGGTAETPRHPDDLN